MRERAHFKNIDEVIATMKAKTIKNKDRKKDFHDASLPSPPDPIITRRVTWLIELLYTTVRTFQLFVPLSTIEQCRPFSQQSKRCYQCERFVPDWVKVSQYRTGLK